MRIAISEIEIARSSSRSAPETRSVGSSHCQISRPAVVARVTRVSAGAVRCSGLKTALSRTTQSPTVSAMTGESRRSRCAGALKFIGFARSGA